MRKLLTCTLAALSAVAAIANPIDENKAKAIASQYMLPGHVMNLVNTAKRAPSKARKLPASVASIAPYYVYSRGEGMGYIVVSGDDCLPEVLGYTEQGDFDESNLPPALKDMLNGYAAAIEDAQVNGTNITANKAKRRAASDRQNIAPFVKSHWHQDAPYNNICPLRSDNGARSMTGCVATAASQILYYWRKDLPATLQSTTPTYSEDGYSHASVTVSIPKGTPLYLDLLQDSYNGAPAEYNEAVATFCYAVGTASRLEYSIEGGTATSGHIEDIPNAFKNYFGMNGGWVAYRTAYSQDAWTKLIYDELQNGRPVMYTGVHPSNGGHAVFIHGYQASTDKFYFNFGWGGQGDGYWTTTLEDGMNGFNEYQSALIGAFPKKWNLNTSISAPSHVYANIDNQFRVTIENNSTLDFSGLYVFAASNTNKPTDITKAKSSNDDVIPVGEKKSVMLYAKPTSVRTWYITVTDVSLNILAQIPVEVEKAEPKLKVVSVDVNGTNEIVEAEGRKFTKIYNTKATVSVNVENSSDVAFGGTAKLDLYSSDNGKTFELVKSISKANSVVEPNGMSSVVFNNVSGLENGKLYYVKVSEAWGSSSDETPIDGSSAVNELGFTVGGACDLAAESFENGLLTLTGHWDFSQFATLVARTSYKTAMSYDLTKVEGMTDAISVDVAFPNPNALVYVNKKVMAPNFVCGNEVCSDLNLTAGYEFTPKSDLVVKGNLSFDMDIVPNSWTMLTVPFDVNVPYGVVARQIDSHRTTSSGISNSTTDVKKMEGGKSYMVITSSMESQKLTHACKEGETVKVLSSPLTNVDPAFIGTFTTALTPEGAKIVKDFEEDKQYFMNTLEGTTVEPFRGYFFDEAMIKSTTNFRAYSNITLDPAYLTLGKAIQHLYDAKQEYADVVTPEANRIMNDSIASAEDLFSSQSLDASTAIKKAANAYEAWIDDYKSMIGNAGNIEIDFTSSIVNPSFELTSTIAKGWTAETSADVKIRSNSSLVYMTVHGDGNNFVSNATGSKLSQEIEGLAEGYYRLKAKVGAPLENADINVFAGDKEVKVTSHPFGKHYLNEAVVDSVLVKEGEKLVIGVKSSDAYNVDDFTLTFIGNYFDPLEIEDIAVDCEKCTEDKNGIYTIQGVKIDEITAPGVYVVNGKKVSRMK